MPNQRSTYIPAPKTILKPPQRVLSLRKTSSSQTERVVLIKEENLTLHPVTKFSQNDGGMRRDYAKAVNYINSCHKFINSIIEKNNGGNKTNIFLLPMVPNFVPIFPHLVGKKMVPKKRDKSEKKTDIEIKVNSRNEERKSKSNFAVKNEEETPIDPAPVGDCGKGLQQIQEDVVAQMVKEQVQSFLNTIHQDMNKAAKKTKSETPKQKCKNLDIVKKRLEELSDICYLRRNIESNNQIVQMAFTPPTPPSFKCTSENCSSIAEDEKKSPRVRKSATSVSSSDIKTDSDLEIN